MGGEDEKTRDEIGKFSVLCYCKFPPQFSHTECVIQCAHSRHDVFINGTQT